MITLFSYTMALTSSLTIENSPFAYVNVDFSFCLVLIVGLNYVPNLRKQNKFFSKHKLLPVNLTWLSQVYGKMFSFPIS